VDLEGEIKRVVELAAREQAKEIVKAELAWFVGQVENVATAFARRVAVVLLDSKHSQEAEFAARMAEFEAHLAQPQPEIDCKPVKVEAPPESWQWENPPEVAKPEPKHATIPAHLRRAEVLRLHGEGKSPEEISEIVGVTARTVRDYLPPANGVVVPSPPFDPQRSSIPAVLRRAEVLRLHDEGKSFAEIAKLAGCCRQRAREIVTRHQERLARISKGERVPAQPSLGEQPMWKKIAALVNEGKTYDEISKALNVSSKTIHNAVYKAKTEGIITAKPVAPPAQEKAAPEVYKAPDPAPEPARDEPHRPKIGPIRAPNSPSMLTETAKAQIREALRQKNPDWDSLMARDWPLKFGRGTMKLTKNDLHNVAVMG
jgi:transposase